MKIKLLVMLIGFVLLAGCATEVSYGPPYYAPYPYYIGPPVVIYHPHSMFIRPGPHHR